MPRKTTQPTDRLDLALDLLKPALAALAEEIVDIGATVLPRNFTARRRILKRLRTYANDSAVLAAACDVLARRPDLLR